MLTSQDGRRPGNGTADGIASAMPVRVRSGDGLLSRPAGDPPGGGQGAEEVGYQVLHVVGVGSHPDSPEGQLAAYSPISMKAPTALAPRMTTTAALIPSSAVSIRRVASQTASPAVPRPTPWTR